MIFITAPQLQSFVFISMPSLLPRTLRKEAQAYTVSLDPSSSTETPQMARTLLSSEKMERHESKDPRSHLVLYLPLNSGLSGYWTELMGQSTQSLVLPDADSCGPEAGQVLVVRFPRKPQIYTNREHGIHQGLCIHHPAPPVLVLSTTPSLCCLVDYLSRSLTSDLFISKYFNMYFFLDKGSFFSF